MEYLGALGRLVALRCASTERTSVAPRYVERVTVEGRRKVQAFPASNRTWDVQWGLADPSEMTPLHAFASGAWGVGPWHWVPVQARVGNMLTPREAQLLEFVANPVWADGGPVRDATGAWQARSISSSLTGIFGQLFRGIPAIPGQKITWSADVQGDGPALALGFTNAGGTNFNAVYGTAPATAGMTRQSLTVTVPDGAVSVYLGLQPSVSRMTRPQLTWTDGPVPYSPGHGCRAAVIDGVAEDLILATSRATYSSTGFTVMEVG